MNVIYKTHKWETLESLFHTLKRGDAVWVNFDNMDGLTTNHFLILRCKENNEEKRIECVEINKSGTLDVTELTSKMVGWGTCKARKVNATITFE